MSLVESGVVRPSGLREEKEAEKRGGRGGGREVADEKVSFRRVFIKGGERSIAINLDRTELILAIGSTDIAFELVISKTLCDLNRFSYSSDNLAFFLFCVSGDMSKEDLARSSRSSMIIVTSLTEECSRFEFREF